ncbi:myb domain protein 12 [Actinidia rufa]|uniref:Myb domain protein 12 n=1 Tax=Actinidia rufa TaxID=165716 RepID=A0A7J0FM38_9ERIC|nr:myb domain protein 12 [Actinidia rufa]
MRQPSSKTTPTPTPCCSKVGMKRGPWTPEEDELLSNYINKEENLIISARIDQDLINKGKSIAYYTNDHGLRSNNMMNIGNPEDDDDINYCTDDVFSSFLNSLINEDVFNNGQHPVQRQINGIVVPAVAADASSDPLISAPQNFALGAGWDAPIMSYDPKRLLDHAQN